MTDSVARALGVKALSRNGAAYAAVQRELARQSYGEVLGLNGKGAVAFTLDDSPVFLKSNALIEFTSRNMPFTLGMIADPANGNNTGVTSNQVTAAASIGDLQKWNWWYGMQLWSHSYTHTTPNSSADLQREIVQSKAQLDTHGLKVEGFIQPGVTPTGAYNNLDKTTDPVNFNSEAGRLIYENYPHYSGYIGGATRRLPTRPYYGATRFTLTTIPGGKTSAQQKDLAIAQIDLAIQNKWGVAFLIHPQWIDWANASTPTWMNLSDLQTIMDYVKTARDAGTLEVLTLAGLLYADPTTATRVNLAKENGVLFSSVSQATPGFWSLTTVWTDKTFNATGTWGGPSFTQDNSQSNSGTNNLQGQINYLHQFAGETFEIRGKVRSTGAGSQKIKIQLTSDIGTFIDIQSSAARGEILATPAGIDFRVPFTIPINQNFLKIALGRGNGSAGTGYGLEWSELDIVKI